MADPRNIGQILLLIVLTIIAIPIAISVGIEEITWPITTLVTLTPIFMLVVLPISTIGTYLFSQILKRMHNTQRTGAPVNAVFAKLVMEPFLPSIRSDPIARIYERVLIFSIIVFLASASAYWTVVFWIFMWISLYISEQTADKIRENYRRLEARIKAES
jgi:hypothetical protein